MALDMKETINALGFVRKAHENQKRKSGEAYIIHPLIMANHAVALGLIEDNLIATILYHDVPEDCGISVRDLPTNKSIANSVKKLTYIKPKVYMEKDGEGPSLVDVKTDYYNKIAEDKVASIAKLIDRCNNVSTMSGVFTKEKVQDYIEETEKFIMPLWRKTKDTWPVYSDALFVIKYHLTSVTDSLKAALQCY